MQKISVIIPCHNQGQYMDDSLRSVYEQTLSNWECLIIDDGSTDNTAEIAKQWCTQDQRFQYHYQENAGVTKARDAGLDMARGEWIQFLDADDLLVKNKFEKSLTFCNDSDIMISDFSMLVEGETRAPFCDLNKYEINFQNLLSGWDVDFNLPIHCPVTRRDLIGSSKFRTELKAKEDLLFWLEIFSKSPRVKFLKESLCFYRHNSQGASKNFLSVYDDNFVANEYIYSLYGNSAKTLLFNKLNKQILELNKTNLDQKTYIRKLQSTKILHIYLKIRKLFSR